VTTVVTWMLPLLSYFDPRLKTVEQAAIPFVDVAVSDKFAGQEGYFEGDTKVESSPDSLDIKMQQALWRKSFEWCRLNKEGLMTYEGKGELVESGALSCYAEFSPERPGASIAQLSLT
jgi:hypothetical protein